MRLPILAEIQEEVGYTNTFLGVNTTNTITDTEFAEMKNLTNDYFPAIGTRKKRGIVRTMTKPQGILGGRYLSFVDNDKFYFDEGYVCDLETTGVERKLVQMGANIVIFPDGIIYNTITGDMEYINIERTTSAAPSFTLCKLDGTNYTDSNCITSNTAPSDTTKAWIDTSQDTVVMKIYDTGGSKWVSVGTTYVKISATGIGTGFKAYDAATLSGVDENRAEVYNQWNFNQSNLIYAAGDDYIIVAGLINKTFTNSKVIKVERKAPQMDFVVENDNRIWGCSSENHEIYACKLGDPTNWYCYAGLDSDSYAVTVGTQNVFTGAAVYSGTVMFFKEDGFHRIYGSKPSNYEVTWKPGRGVQYGSDKSIAVVNDILMFKARDGVCAYQGSTDSVSDKIDSVPYYSAVAAGYRNKYYISMKDENYQYKTYVYDMSKNTWIIEDDKRFTDMVTNGNGLYMIGIDNVMYISSAESVQKKWFPSGTMFPSATLLPGNITTNVQEESKIEWSMTTGDIGVDSPYQKYIKRIDMRLFLDTDAKIRIEVMYDSSDSWVTMLEYFSTKKRSYNIPIKVERCDHLRIRMSGFGNMRLFSISKHIEQGSDN